MFWCALVLLIVARQQVEAGPPLPGFACPNCDLDAPKSYVCKQGSSPFNTYTHSGTTTSSSVPVPLCVQAPPGLVSCDNSLRLVRANGPLSNLTTDSNNCGACGNVCVQPSNSCVNGNCGCIIGKIASNSTVRCDITSGKLLPCPQGLANCDNGIGDSGNPNSDCETTVATDINNCGACGFKCGVGHTCVNGQCFCGAVQGQCKFPQDKCSNGQCVECNSLSDWRQCGKASILQDHRFCNSTQGACVTCPLGMGDCTALNTTGGADTGLPTDCETNFNNSFGQTAACKCGKFANANSPTLGECDAGITCSTTEYCDQVLAKCLPKVPGLEDCRGTASIIDSSDPYLGTGNGGVVNRVCGSCNATIASTMVINNTCQASNSLACGANGAVCKTGQTCYFGKCGCSQNLVLSTLLIWSPFADQDPDRDFKFDVYGEPQSGCNGIVTSVLDGFFDRSMNTLTQFAQCIGLSQGANITTITPPDFRNATFRAIVCPGGAGKCPAAFCDALANNFTGNDRSAFCNAASNTAAKLKSCAQNRVIAGNKVGDLTCSNIVALEYTDTSPNPSAGLNLNFIDMFNILGCDQAKDDLIIQLPNGPRSAAPMYRAETAFRLLGAASTHSISSLVGCFLLVVAAPLLLLN